MESVLIGGVTYPLVMNNKAAIEIYTKFGGLEEMGARLDQTDNLSQLFTDTLWLMTLFINQGILKYNYSNKDAKRELLDEDYIGVMTDPKDLMAYREAVIAAFTAGSTRHIESEGGEPLKNGEPG